MTDPGLLPCCQDPLFSLSPPLSAGCWLSVHDLRSAFSTEQGVWPLTAPGSNPSSISEAGGCLFPWFLQNSPRKGSDWPGLVMCSLLNQSLHPAASRAHMWLKSGQVAGHKVCYQRKGHEENHARQPKSMATSAPSLPACV